MVYILILLKKKNKLNENEKQNGGHDGLLTSNSNNQKCDDKLWMQLSKKIKQCSDDELWEQSNTNKDEKILPKNNFYSMQDFTSDLQESLNYTQNNFDVTKPTLINYWADWCGASNRFNPTWKTFKSNVETKYPHLQITELNVGNDQKLIKLASRVGVKGYPTLVLFYNNKIHSQAGNMSIDQIHLFIDKVIKN